MLDAFERWHELQADAGRPIIELNGVIRIAPVGSSLHAAFRTSAEAWNLPYETLDQATIVERFPGFSVPDGYEGLFEERAGFVHAAAAVRAFQERARRHGAQLHFEEPMLTWSADDRGVTVTTPAGSLAAGSLVVTVGPWTARLLASLALPLVPHRIVNASFVPLRPELFDPAHLPTFIVADDERLFYGVPSVPGEGVKVGAGGVAHGPG